MCSKLPYYLLLPNTKTSIGLSICSKQLFYGKTIQLIKIGSTIEKLMFRILFNPIALCKALHYSNPFVFLQDLKVLVEKKIFENGNRTCSCLLIDSSTKDYDSLKTLCLQVLFLYCIASHTFCRCISTDTLVLCWLHVGSVSFYCSS